MMSRMPLKGERPFNVGKPTYMRKQKWPRRAALRVRVSLIELSLSPKSILRPHVSVSYKSMMDSIGSHRMYPVRSTMRTGGVFGMTAKGGDEAAAMRKRHEHPSPSQVECRLLSVTALLLAWRWRFTGQLTCRLCGLTRAHTTLYLSGVFRSQQDRDNHK